MEKISLLFNISQLNKLYIFWIKRLTSSKKQLLPTKSNQEKSLMKQKIIDKK